MGVSYEDAIKAQTELEDKMFSDPNVVSVGVVAETNEFGEKTGDYAVQVGVISVDVYARAKKHGQSAIPAEFLLRAENGSREEKHIHVHVVREGKIEALTSSSIIEKDDTPSAIDELPESTTSTDGYASRLRPTPCGHSIGHPDVTAGTLGLLVEYTDGPNLGKAYILSNNHVMAANNLASFGDPIIQPGKHDSGVVGRDTIASLHRWVPLKLSDFNYVDAAIAEVKGGLKWSPYVSAHITRIGIPGDLVDPSVGMRVEKVGRTTGYTQGEIISARFSTKINYPIGTLTFKNQIRTTSMSKGGDSGSCLVEQGTKKPVGLLFAGSDTASYCNPITSVLSYLSMYYTYQYSSGKTVTFNSDYPLRILQKRSYSTIAATNFSSKGTFFSRNLKAIPTRYVAPVSILVSIGFYAASRVQHSEESTKRAGRLLPLISGHASSVKYLK